MFKKIILLVAIALSPIMALAQNSTGILKGKVIDKSNNEALIGATVYIKTLNKGAVTDVNGQYEFKGIPAGKYSVEVSYIGYVKNTVKEVKVSAGMATVLDIEMLVDASSISEIIVTDKIQMDFAQSYNTTPMQESKISIRAYSNYAGNVADDYYEGESYSKIDENGYKMVLSAPMSTFSADVDVASYANLRRFLTNGDMPPVDAVRVEEMINYFTYKYNKPRGNNPVNVQSEVAQCPWNTNHKLVRIGLKAREIPTEELPASNIVFLLDVSGSMGSLNKLPLLQKSMRLLVNNLGEEDRVAIVVYAGAAGLVLPSTAASQKQTILNAIDQLRSGGSTAGGAGIKLAYKVATENFIKNGNNRIILATDGDFNVGASSDADMERLIEEKRESGVFLTVLGFGMGNYQDSKMETLADKGNGNYAYIDNLFEAQKVLVSEMGSTLHTVAKDVKIQVQFNPAKVKAYRLIGYENRLLNDEDFEDDTKDAGEMGAGHSVTALYEIIPAGSDEEVPGISDLKYLDKDVNDFAKNSQELLNVDIRYKDPDGDESKLLRFNLLDNDTRFSKASEDFRFAASVAAFGMLVRESEYTNMLTYNQVKEMAKEAKGKDDGGYRVEFIRLIDLASSLSATATTEE